MSTLITATYIEIQLYTKYWEKLPYKKQQHFKLDWLCITMQLSEVVIEQKKLGSAPNVLSEVNCL